MTEIGQRERLTQNRVVALLRDALDYQYLGDLTDRSNMNVDAGLLATWLSEKRGVPSELAARAIAQLERTAGNLTKSLYDRNREVYELLRYGVQVRPDVGEQSVTVDLIDWEHPLENDFAVAEEVTVVGKHGPGSTKRPDIVLYVNGIAVVVIELKRSIVSIGEGIRQNLDNQKPDFIEHFFSTVQWLIAGNDTQGLRYGAIQTPEKFYLAWKEPSGVENPLDRSLLQICAKERLLELIHDFVVFDAGTKKLSRPNQYFGVKAAQEYVLRHEGGIIWHTQGSGKSLTMVWLARWIREHVTDARVIIITDRTELDEQIEGVFRGVGEQIYRTTSGADLLEKINAATPWFMCSLIHKFGPRSSAAETAEVPEYIKELRAALPAGFSPKGTIFVFVDECHRTQSGVLHDAMKQILPDAMFVGFTGTPLLRAEKPSIHTFGPYIHTYKFDEAVRDGVIVDLRYEARDIDQRLSSPEKVDQWFAAKTEGLNDVAKAELKRRWGTMQRVLSARSRLEQIVDDIIFDMETRDRLRNGRGNALLVSGSIYEACIFYDLFQHTPLTGHVGIVTSYKPTTSDIKGEESGEGETLPVEQYNIYKQMLADWFRVDPDAAVSNADEYETQVKKKFVEEPGQIKLLIVVDKLLTGFDAPSATYLYIDKQMRDHGLFQAICRVNRVDGDDKEYGYVVDYKDLFKSLASAVRDYTSGALDGYDKGDIEGLLQDRISGAKQDLEDALEATRALVEPVEPPRDRAAYLRYFCAVDSGDGDELADNAPKRVALYKQVAHLVRAFANLAGDHLEAGYTQDEFEAIRAEVDRYEKLRAEIKLASGDYIDLKMYEPAMRHLIDTYIKAEESRKLSSFDDMSFVEMLVDRGTAAVDELPEDLRKTPENVAEVIENNVRRLIIDEQPINPKYYDKMSALLDALILQRRQASIDYEQYLEQIIDLAKKVQDPSSNTDYPSTMNTSGRRALYDFLNHDEQIAIEVDTTIHTHAQDGWRGNLMKTRRIRQALLDLLSGREVDVDEIIELVKQHHAEY